MNKAYITIEGLQDEDRLMLSGVGIGEIQHLRKSGTYAFTITAETDSCHMIDAVRSICAIIEEHSPILKAMLRRYAPQLGLVVEGSEKEGFPSLNIDARTIAFLHELNASFDVSIHALKPSH